MTRCSYARGMVCNFLVPQGAYGIFENGVRPLWGPTRTSTNRPRRLPRGASYVVIVSCSIATVHRGIEPMEVA